MLAATTDRTEQIVLLQHAIDNITSTFYTQVMFADFELAAHERVERDQPVTAEALNELYQERFALYYGDAVETEALTPITWARIPHFFNSPFYVYQYATCFASAARLAAEVTQAGAAGEAARARYLDLLAAGGSDHPMNLLANAGVDLSQPETIQAVVDQLETLVGRLEALV
jgi:oligoendopeptidase F